jgi:dolichyl-phosphate beta-glucosyltransferase
MDLAFSLIIPAYNEAQRLPPFLDSVRQHLDARYPGGYEVIIVDDGSRDGLPEVLAPFEADWAQLCVKQHPGNQGKGAAVRTGMLAASGQLLLFADADGATPIDQETKLSEAVRAGADVAVGSRLVPGANVTRRRDWTRAVAGRVFASVARWWLGISVRDTQCGFKMFRREAGRELFSRSRESGYLFDLELLLLAARLDYRVAEVAVNWTEIPGGHLSMTGELRRILIGLWRLRRSTGQHEAAESRQE